jgi:molecular chaperone HtpG
VLSAPLVSAQWQILASALRIETRNIDSGVTLISSAKREDLRIAQDCIDLERVIDHREPGTIIIAHLDDTFAITEDSVCDYLSPYVRFLHVPVLVNGKLISQQQFESTLAERAPDFARISSRVVSQGQFSGTVETLLNSRGRALARLTKISLNGNLLTGEAFFVQEGGQTLGFRNLFGLAPIPVSSQYNFGGIVNLNILQPTAGREALSRESIQHVANLVSLIEADVSRAIAETPAADQNQNFQQYILSKGLVALAKNVTVSVLPSGSEIALGQLEAFEPTKKKLFYAGRDPTILQRFASEQTNLIHASQGNPRRTLQQWLC